MIKYRKLEGHSVQRITSDKGRYPTAQLMCVFVVLDLGLWPWASTAYSALPCRRRHLCTKFRQNPPLSIIWVKSRYGYRITIWSVSLPKLNAVFRDSQAIHSQNVTETRLLLLAVSALQFWIHVRIQDPDSDPDPAQNVTKSCRPRSYRPLKFHRNLSITS